MRLLHGVEGELVVVNQIPESARARIATLFIERKSIRETAEIVGVAVNTVRRYHRLYVEASEREFGKGSVPPGHKGGYWEHRAVREKIV